MSDRLRAPSPLLIVLLGLAAACPSPSRAAPMSAQLTTSERNQLQREARLVVDLVQNFHYSGATFHEIRNQEILDRFVHELDPQGDILTADDREFIHQRFDRSLKSVYLFRGDLGPAFEIFDLYVGRARDRFAWVDRRLGSSFDFTVNESYTELSPDQPAPPSEIPVDHRWELRLKDQLLHEILSGRTPDEARDHLRQVYAEANRALRGYDSFAVRERFLDAAIRSFDPHSGYSSADSARRFAVEMKGTLTGVGISFQKEHGRCTVTEIYPGGPADLHSTLAPGDTIEALAHDDGPWIETRGQRMREIEAAMQGPDNGKLRIAYRPAGDGERKEITLDRTRVVLGGDRAYGAISQVVGEGGTTRPIGWIMLPAFYAGGEGQDATSAARDVRELIEQMQAAKVEGLVLDLRSNPGGSLPEAVAMSQLFLARGVVMLTRGIDGTLNTLALKEGTPLYTGPLVVLTSPRSASAAEIFAGAMKYHRRALVVGGPATFGKGTVQNYVDLAKFLNLTGESVKDWGMLRLTSQRFYLPDGSSVQRQGVASDVVLPDLAPSGLPHESGLPHALAAETVVPPGNPGPAAGATPALSGELRQYLTTCSTRDVATLPEWKLWHQDFESYRKLAERGTRTVMMEARSREWEQTLAELKAARQLRREFAANAAFATRRLDIAVVQAARDAHEAKLRELATAGGRNPPGHLARGAFLVETSPGHWRDLPLPQIDFLQLAGDAGPLAEAFAQGSGTALTIAEMRTMLQDLSLLDQKSDEAVRSVVAKVAKSSPDSPAVWNGTEAMLTRITELEPGLLHDYPAFDVPMRECLRLAADWAGRLDAPHP